MTATTETSPSAPHAADRVNRGLVAGLFGVYLVLLAWLVLFKLDVPVVGGVTRSIKLVPFVAGQGFGASVPAEVVANVLIFVPFGAYLALLAPARSLPRITATLAGASFALESVQFVLAVGSSDVTDVLVNTAGGLAGCGLVAVVRRTFGVRGVQRALAVGTVIAVLASAAFVASPTRYGPPPDGPRPPQHSGTERLAP
ncbi:VanZ family protein [Microbacterium sp. M3]|uniref:VanZ family protein n=1 Tax=Microbacterium arthrosphaerae TaxID=792652 RepID=A0ABU4H4K2_9MICO|nr:MULTISPECIES: VanZ family protein [Microbacterium]MDW4574266.1 VanZ family protein [Microbacterium arthrosphaerae]MDW7608121.1 VanZ family protein [Microbacterium sp. M3]